MGGVAGRGRRRLADEVRMVLGVPGCLGVHGHANIGDVSAFTFEGMPPSQGWQVILPWSKFVEVGAMRLLVIFFIRPRENSNIACIRQTPM